MPLDHWFIWALGMSPPVVALVWTLVQMTNPRSQKAMDSHVAMPMAKSRRFSMSDVEGPLTGNDVDERAQWVSDAMEAEYLDAAFLIRYYNVDRRRWGPEPKPPAIEPAEVFGQRFDREKFSQAVDQVDGLLKDATAVASAHFGYPGTVRSAEEELRLLRDGHPGFSERAYDSAVHSAMIAMR